FMECFRKFLSHFESEFGDSEKEFLFVCKEMEELSQGYSKEDSEAIALFLGQCPQGVISMSRALEGFVELSNNLGVISSDENGVKMEVLYRANDSGQMKDLARQTARLAESYGWTAVVESENPSWPSKLPSAILDLAEK